MVMEPFVKLIYKQVGAFHSKHAHMMTIGKHNHHVMVSPNLVTKTWIWEN